MPDSVSQLPLVEMQGCTFYVELYMDVASEEQLLQLNRALIGDGDDALSRETRYREIECVQIPGVELGSIKALVSSVHGSPRRIGVIVAGPSLLSANFAHWEFREVDVGTGAVVASMIRVAAFAHQTVPFPGASLVREDHASVSSDAFVLELDWAEALGLTGPEAGFRMTRVSWEQVHAFDAEAAVRALYDRRLKAAKAGPRS